MGMLSVRLPDDLEEMLSQEARLSHKKRAEVIRDAIVQYLRDQEQKRFMDEMVSAVKAIDRDESEALEADFLEADNEALELALGPEPEEKWWK